MESITLTDRRRSLWGFLAYCLRGKPLAALGAKGLLVVGVNVVVANAVLQDFGNRGARPSAELGPVLNAEDICHRHGFVVDVT